LIGSIRRECADHLIVVNEEHPRRILAKFAGDYNHARTHTSPRKDTPYTRPIESFTLLRIRFLAGYTIDMHESSFRKRQVAFSLPRDNSVGFEL
jgi:hypothetical protein